MVVERIRNLDINSRPVFTGLYGNCFGQEFFVEDNLCKYSFWQELYRYLRSEGYTTVFYNAEFNFFSFEESQLEVFFFKKPEDISSGKEIGNVSKHRFIAPIASPNGHNRRRGIRLTPTPDAVSTRDDARTSSASDAGSDDLVSHRPNAIIVKNIVGDSFFQLRRSEAVLRQFFDFMDKNPHHKLAIIFTKPSEVSFSPEEEAAWRSRLQADFLRQRVADLGHRLIVCYDCKSIMALRESFTRERGFFFDDWFRNQMFPEYTGDRPDLSKPSPALFYVDVWGKDEVGNILKRKRIMDGLKHTLSPIPFDDLCLRIWQQFQIKNPDGSDRNIDTVKDFMAMSAKAIETQLLRIDNEKAMDRLKKLRGLESVTEKFEQYLEDLRYSRENGTSFRPHMVFMGNPGTGKTTVARIFADVLREEGLLENGRLHQVTVGDLVSQFVGETRIKTQEVCQKARGGVLFLDEAYGLFQSGSADSAQDNGGNRTGQEAIEVLLQFMENDRRSLVILAGYTDQMEDLLQHGNIGFDSRIGTQGRFVFDDYPPEVLTQIALDRLEGTSCTEDFRQSLMSIFSVLFKFRDKTWANARTAENTISRIMSNYRARRLSGPYDIDAIPEDLMRLIRTPSPAEADELTRELNGMVGLSKVKEELRMLFGQVKRLRSRKSVNSGEYEMSNLTFIFEGNPGTGKTTVARLMGRILAGYGLILSPEVIEKGLGDIVSGIHGGSVKLVNEMFDQSIGKVLFIDEAYALADERYQEIVTQIVQNLTHEKYQGKMAVILAGYPSDMRRLLQVNAGFVSRFRYHYVFEDYSEDELLQMFRKHVEARGMRLSEGCESWILTWFKSNNRAKNANARLVRTLYETVNANMGLRLSADDAADDLILPEDIPQTRRFPSQSPDQILAKLNGMVGLRSVKEKLLGIIADVSAQRRRAECGQTEESKVGLNFVFQGNPGTGKTTVARLLGEILASFELIDEPTVLTFTKKQLVGSLVGSSAQNVEKAFEDAVGKVLFIDEAYQLADNESKDALDTLTNMLTDTRFKDNLAVILAGYPGQMAELINANPGLYSRFTQIVFFDDYDNEELTEIFRRKVETEHFTIGEEALAHARAYFTGLKRNIAFGNAREAENLLAVVKGLQGRRLLEMSDSSGEDYFTLLPQDFPNFGKIKIERFIPQQKQSSSPMEKLDQLSGIGPIRELFKTYVQMFHYVLAHPQEKIASTFRRHMAFLGNPGTGKTTVARLFGEILRDEGLLSSNNFVEVAPSDLIGQYVGQSAPKAMAVFERARGGILFIDEAYELYKKGSDGGGNQFGENVITALIKFMEDDRDSIVILAGYTDELRYLIERGNAGLESRVTNFFEFQDYDPDALYDIFLSKLSDYSLTDDFKETMRDIIKYQYDHRVEKRWGNAREMENYAAEVFKNFLAKHQGEGTIGIDCIPERLITGLMRDLSQQVSQTERELDGRQKELNSPSMLTVDLRSNQADKRVADTIMLKERATGLLKSSVGEGTAFIISLADRYVLTCSHVIEGAGDDLTFIMNRKDFFETKARVIWSNYTIDMALLQLEELPDNACFVPLDSDIDTPPKELTELILCGYPDGSAFASTPSLIQGYINNYEKQHAWNDRCFDTIYANVSATHGCSGGPVVRKEDLVLVGILQGGKEGGEIQFITDIHQLFRTINIIS